MKYTDEGRGFIQHENLCIPVDPKNRDYRKIVAPFLAAGGRIEEPDPPIPEVKSVRDAAIEAMLIDKATEDDAPPEVVEYVTGKNG